MKKKDALRVYIVEDQAVSRALLEDLLTDNGYNIAGSASRAEVAWEELQNCQTDLVLLDIHLAGEQNGIWLAKRIRESIDLPIVYLTAFGDSKTIQEVVDTQPNGYLMKPYNLPTLLTTLNIALENYTSQRSNSPSKNLDDGIAHDEHLFVKDGYTMVKLRMDDIQYVQSDGNYIHIYLDERKYTVRSKLSVFGEQLSGDTFMLIHQRYIVNLNHVVRIESDKVVVGQEEIPVSRTHKKELQDRVVSSS